MTENHHLRGMLWMTLATIWMASMHAAVRHVSEHVHPFEITFFASLFGLIVVFPSFLRSGLAPLRTARLGLHVVRSIFHVVAMFTFFFALGMAPLALVTALAFTAPVYASILAIPLFGERLDAHRWAAVFAGFIGILIVLRPGLTDLDPGASVALAASVVFSGMLVATKSLSRTESSITITSYMLLLMLPMSLIPALFVWHWPNRETFLWLVFIGIASAFGRLLLAQALKEAPTHVVMPVDFCRLIWVTILGYLVFDDVPDPYSWMGGAVVVMSVAFIAYKEHKTITKTWDHPVHR